MSLQIRVPETVGERLAVPQTQRNNRIHFSELLNPHSSSATIYFGDRNIFVRISQTLALLEERMPKGEGFGYDINSKDT